MIFTSLVGVLFAVSFGQCAKILAIFPMTSQSHYILGSAITRELAERGHDVTMVSSFGEKHPPQNGSYRDIVLTGLVENHDRKMKEMNIFKVGNINPLLMATFMTKFSTDLNEKILNHTNVQPLFNPEEQFDVVIIEEFLLHAVKAFALRFNAPLILLSTMGANVWVNSLVGNPTPVAYVPDTLLGLPSNMNFFERLYNSFNYVFHQTLSGLLLYPMHNRLIQKYFSDPPHIDEVLYNVSLVLLNAHTSVNQPVPYVPNMIDIGGFHVKPPKKLPSDLQEYLDSAEHGVIYFSLGSNIKAKLMPPEKLQVFLNTLAKLKEKVLWKWEEDVLPGKPDNVKVGKWLPQQDILAHPNVKLFMTHAGLLSTIETIYHGVPVLGIPIAGDQNMNAQQMVDKGIGLALRFQDVCEEALSHKLDELLNNPIYRQNVQTRSRLFHDRLVSPMDTAVYWIEYVIRHQGAPHLRVAALDLPWYKYFLLDVIAFLFIVFVLVSYATVKIAKRVCCKRKAASKKIKKQ